MRHRPKSFRIEILQAVLSALIVIVTGVDLIGREARLPHILILVTGGIGAGITIGRLVERRRQAKLQKNA